MLRQTSDAERRNPASVPTTPIAAPVMRKMRMIAPCVAPMVRRMAMSWPLSFTSMIRPEMMLSAATSTISVRIRNITLRSTCERGEEGRVALPPVDHEDRPLRGRRSTTWRIASTWSGLSV